MLEEYKRIINFWGNQYKTIKVGGLELDKGEFIKQCTDVGFDWSKIQEFLNQGYYMVQHRNGEVKYCPKCSKIRQTSCSACGCGSCSICGYRWVCRSNGPFTTDVNNINVYINNPPKL